MAVAISLGPVPSASVLAWAATARQTIDAVRARPELGVPAEVADAFERYVDEWAAIAERAEAFEWEGTIEPAVARRLSAYWLLLVTIARDRPPAQTGIAPAPPEGREFFEALATMMAAASSAGDEEEFATAFEQAVPGFAERAPRSGAGRPTRVLIVDDNEDMRLLYRSMFEFDPDFDVVGEARNGVEAVDIASTARPDAALLDVMMPVMDGMTALPLLRAVCPQATVVVVTAVVTPSVVETARGRGAADVVRKGTPFATLKAAIRPPAGPGDVPRIRSDGDQG